MRRFLPGSLLALAVTPILAALVAPTLLAQQTTKSVEDKFQSAQRHIYAAIGDLEEYVRTNPQGKDQVTAKLQIKNLQSLSVVSAQSRFVTLSAFGDAITAWRIVTVDQRPSATRITFEIRNTSDADTHWFLAFDQCPLVLVDNLGQYYPSGDISPLPRSIERGQSNWNDPAWLIHGGQAITLTVEFPPLQPTATGGRVLYKETYPGQGEPATFSLLNRKQLAGG